MASRAAADRRPTSAAARWSRWAAGLEWLVAASATLAALYLHWRNLRLAGGLWRDEAHTAEVASFQSLAELKQMLPLDSFPLLSTLVWRVWTLTAFGAGDFGLRLFGLFVGAAILGALWLNAWRTHRAAPCLALWIWGFNPVAIRFGDAVRPHGIGVLLMVLCWGLVWGALRSPSKTRIALAALTAVLSVQCLYQNAFFVLAIIAGAAVVCLRRGRWKLLAIVLGLGLLAAVSLLPYVPALRAARDWSALTFNVVDLRSTCERLFKAFGGADGRFEARATAMLLITAAAVAVARQFRRGPTEREQEGDLDLYALTTVFFGAGAMLLLFWKTSVLAQPWHYLGAVAIAATAVDGVLGSPRAGAALRAVLLAGFVVMTWNPILQSLQTRQTNLDLIAAHLESHAAADDLIVIEPWYRGVTFHRYYHGRAPWITIPPLAEPRLHRYDLLKEQMRRPAPLAPVTAQMAHTLAGGYRVWLVGDFPGLPVGFSPVVLAPAPRPETGWESNPYLDTWRLQAGYFLQHHELSRRFVPIEAGQPVNDLENPELHVAEGWLPDR